jgi:hypothetical protein
MSVPDGSISSGARGAGLTHELLDYEIKVNEHANLVAGAMRVGAHDDLVTALGLATLDESIVTPAITLGPTFTW